MEYANMDNIVRYKIPGIQGIQGLKGLKGIGGPPRPASRFLEGREYKWSDKLQDFVDWIPTGNGTAIPKTYTEAYAESQTALQAQEALKEIYADLVAPRQNRDAQTRTQNARSGVPQPQTQPWNPEWPFPLLDVIDEEAVRDERIVNRSYQENATPKQALCGLGVELARKRTYKAAKAKRGDKGVYNLTPREIFSWFKAIIAKFLRPKWTTPTVRPYSESERLKRKEMRRAFFRQRELFRQITQDAPPSNLEESQAQIDKLEIEADYTKTKKSVELEYANLVNREIARFFDTFGDTGTVSKIAFVDHLRLEVAQYNQDTFTISFQNLTLEQLQKRIDKMHECGHWKSTEPGDIIWHELGHSYMTMLKDDVNFGARYSYAERLANEYKRRGVWRQSKYGERNQDEFFAELAADKRANPKCKEVNYLLRIFMDDDFVSIFNEALNGTV